MAHIPQRSAPAPYVFVSGLPAWGLRSWNNPLVTTVLCIETFEVMLSFSLKVTSNMLPTHGGLGKYKQ